MSGFEERHGGAVLSSTASGLSLAGGDGERADVVLPFPPWHGGSLEDAVTHLARRRRVLVLLVRRGGYGLAVIDSGEVVASKVGSRHVQGRTAAGGWSQQRYARRRAKQAGELVTGVADHAVRLLLPAAEAAAGTPVWLATGGDRSLVADVLRDRRLSPLTGLPRAGHLAVGDPDRRTLAALPTLVAAVNIRLTEARQEAPHDG